MAGAANTTVTSSPGESGTTAGQRLQLGIRLQPVEHSDQPIFTNMTAVQGAPGTMFVDFGFIEPSALPAVARLAQSGGKMPEAIPGQLACRVVMGVDTALQLARQLERHIQALSAQASRRPAGDADAKP
jgi:hypothetical protein